MRPALVPLAIVLVLAGCRTSGSDWVRELGASESRPSSGSMYFPAPASSRARSPRRTVRIGERAETEAPLAETEPDPTDGAEGERMSVVAEGNSGPFRITYYDFPVEAASASDSVLFDASCNKIAGVSREFHDTVCVQGSGRLSSGRTVSFARRDCECASICPRSGQRICFEELDARVFPWGRGATGLPIVPLVTVAVDVGVIALGSTLLIPEAAGLPRLDGSPHDGCFIAQDRGLRVVGRHVDVFAGPPEMRSLWNARLPSNRGVHVLVDDPRCPRPRVTQSR